ncbi:MAG: hypothetical protein Q7T15_01675 [Microcella sp.]|uniref:hypothetical protein n=1 Tax=Microcella sp. TaxID=1913979 RepID=UPI002722B507|nr:hypothetical protein [Microcella sp.]MDO8336946.1 hypothetical protein [Microcella sp.]
MTSSQRAFVALALLGASIVHLAVAASGVAAPAALLLGALGIAEAAGVALVARSALGTRPAALAALLLVPLAVPTGALTIADLLERPDLVAALTRPALLGAAALTLGGALVAGAASRRLRMAGASAEGFDADARRSSGARPATHARPALAIALGVLVAAAITGSAVAASRIPPDADATAPLVEPAAIDSEAEPAGPRITAGHEGHGRP